MFPPRHIFMPIDFGPATDPAIDAAVALARALDGGITLAHVFDITPFSVPLTFGPPLDLEPHVQSLEKEVQAAAARVRNSFRRVEAVLLRGVPEDVILSESAKRRCDLIVMGSRGRKGIAHALLGSVAERVVRLSDIPVLTVHPLRTVGPPASSGT